jgi:phosphatidylethanolamine/phosphatidyl-N-methylethanolamine N-methyltransferase
MSHYAEFLQGLLLAPRAVCAPTPSGPVLAATMAGQVDLSRRGLVVELGPGSGTVTEALIARGMPQSRLLAWNARPISRGCCRIVMRRPASLKAMRLNSNAICQQTPKSRRWYAACRF